MYSDDYVESIMFPKVAVVILNYNGRRCLGKLLDESIESALNQTYPDIEVIFADNGSQDDSVEYVAKKYGNKVKIVVLGNNYGFCHGNNIAVQYASYDVEYVLFLNPDAVIRNDYVEKLVHFMQSDTLIGIAQGLQILSDNSLISPGGLITTHGKSILINIKQFRSSISGKAMPVLWVSGSAMMIRKGLFDKLGGFSDELFMYYDEINLCCKALALDYKVMGLLSTTYLHKASDYRLNLVSWYFNTRNRWLIVMRYFPARMIPQCFFSLAVDFFATIYQSWKFRKNKNFSSKQWVKLYLRIIKYLAKNARREIALRTKSAKCHYIISNYSIRVSIPQIVMDYSRMYDPLQLKPKIVSYMVKRIV